MDLRVGDSGTGTGSGLGHGKKRKQRLLKQGDTESSYQVRFFASERVEKWTCPDLSPFLRFYQAVTIGRSRIVTRPGAAS